MVHPDYQYTPKLITAMASLIANGVYDVVLGSRILGKGARIGGMPLHKYVANRILTLVQNLMIGRSCPSTTPAIAHSPVPSSRSCRSRRTRTTSIFDNQILVQAFHFGFRVGEVSCPTRYFPEASSIDLWRSSVYGLGCLWNSVQFILCRIGVFEPRFLRATGRRLPGAREAES